MCRLTLAWCCSFRAYLLHVRVAWEVVTVPANSRVDLHTAGWWWGPPNMCIVIIPSRTWLEYNDPKTVAKCRDKILYLSDCTLVRDACAIWKTERRKNVFHFCLSSHSFPSVLLFFYWFVLCKHKQPLLSYMSNISLRSTYCLFCVASIVLNR